VFARYFIDRPIFASVLSIVITLIGGIGLVTLPIAEFPTIAPPTVQVDCTYPGASAEVVAQTVATPIEQQVNGVENMLYMASQCNNDGAYSLTVTFKHGVDLNMAQVRVQNRVALAVPLLPDVLRQTGVTVKKRSPDILLVIALNSMDGSRDQLYLSNYALMHIKDELARMPGVADVILFGQRDYSMRVWVDPEKLAARNLSAGDVAAAIREQNAPVAAGHLGQPPTCGGPGFQFPLSVRGRMVEAEEFADIIVKRTAGGRIVRLRDVARVELGPKNQDISAKVNGMATVGLAVFQLPDANALRTAELIKAKVDSLAVDFPSGVSHVIRYDTTPFIRESIGEVGKTLRDAVLLVALVVLLFLQNWRTAIIPLLTVPVAIVGTFGAMAAFGFSLNNLTLFGLVLAIGIVVDDAIVVVEAVEQQVERGFAPREATIRALDEVARPVIAIGLVLTAIFVPCAVVSGLVGQFFRQFALTIAVSTLISAFNSLTLSPALAALLIRPHTPQTDAAPLPRGAFAVVAAVTGWFLLGPVLASHLVALPGGLDSGRTPWWLPAAAAAVGSGVAGWFLGRPLNRVLGGFFVRFNAGFQRLARGYGVVVGGLLRQSVLVLAGYAGLLYLTYWGFQHTPTGFVPSQDMGYLLINVQLPDAAAIERTQAAMDRIEKICLEVPGVRFTQTITGQSLILSSNGSNFGTMIIILDEFARRRRPELYGEAIATKLRTRLTEEISEAAIAVFGPPPVRGVGRAGGFKLMIEDRGDFDPKKLQEATESVLAAEREQGFDLQLISERSGAGRIFLPKEGKDLIIVAAVNQVLHFRIFDGEGNVVVDTGEKSLPAQARQIKELREQLQGLWPPYELTRNDKERVIPAVTSIVGHTRKQPIRLSLVSPFRANVPQYFGKVDPNKVISSQISPQDLFDTLRIYLGSLYVNDFNRFGRTWQVIVQADAPFRTKPQDVRRLKVRNLAGAMVPLGSLGELREIEGPLILMRYNMYTAAPINGNAPEGVSSGDAIKLMDELADKTLPATMSHEWTEMAYLELQAGNTAMLVFGFAVALVFLVLAAQYESWSLPLAVILVVPMCLLSALVGVRIVGGDINIFTQIGFVVLVGLASKNAILIVEFARSKRESGMPRRQAALEACTLRLRPIVMTSMAFVLGVLPLVLSQGAGAEMRRTLGTTVFSGMLGVTLFGVLLTPVFFFVIDWLGTTTLFTSPLLRGVNDLSLGLLTLRFLRIPFRRMRRAAAVKAPAGDLEPSPSLPLKDGLLDELGGDFESPPAELIEKT
jgi:multidrug efflux pump